MLKLYELISSEVLLAESKLRLSVPSDIKKLYKLFKNNGKQLFVVGGAVRDAILGKSPKDFDLATDAKPDDVLDIAKQGGFKTVEVGKSFGVVIVNGHEIATFRKDIGKGRRPDSVDYTDIEGDVKRRDLTINALFYDIGRAEIVDLVGGIKDLKKKRIRTVGNPEQRFDEDPLRKLRAVRFAGSVGGRMDKETWQALANNPDISGVSAERIRDEFIKGIKKAKSVQNYLKMVLKLGMFNQIYPGLRINKSFTKTNDYIVQIANILRKQHSSSVYMGLSKLKYTKQEVRDVNHLLQLSEFQPENIYQIKVQEKLTKLDNRQIKEWAAIVGGDVMKVWKFKLTVTAKDAVSQGYKGKEIGDFIKDTETTRYLGK